MIKAVFFDLYQTLVHYQPSQEELEAAALKNLGINVTADALRHPILTANEFIYQQMAQPPFKPALPGRNDGALFGIPAYCP